MATLDIGHHHFTVDAVGPAKKRVDKLFDKWLIAHGWQFGLCQIYANEIWHFELATDEQGRCPPLKPNATG